jgi:SnoaL-like domain
MTDDITALKHLKYRYLRTLDTKRWEEYADTLAADVTADYAGLTFESREPLVEYMKANLGPSMITLHQAHHPEIEVDGDEATGRWYLEDKVIMPDFNMVLEGAAIYTDRYRRTDGGWVITHTGYRRTYDLTYPMDGMKLKVGTAYDD